MNKKDQLPINGKTQLTYFLSLGKIILKHPQMYSYAGYQGILNVTQVLFQDKERMVPQMKESVCPKR